MGRGCRAGHDSRELSLLHLLILALRAPSCCCCCQLAPPPTLLPIPAPVAFRIYDIGGNGRIERVELKRFLVALMADNPDVDLDEQALDEIVDQVCMRALPGQGFLFAPFLLFWCGCAAARTAEAEMGCCGKPALAGSQGCDAHTLLPACLSWLLASSSHAKAHRLLALLASPA